MGLQDFYLWTRVYGLVFGFRVQGSCMLELSQKGQLVFKSPRVLMMEQGFYLPPTCASLRIQYVTFSAK